MVVQGFNPANAVHEVSQHHEELKVAEQQKAALAKERIAAEIAAQKAEVRKDSQTEAAEKTKEKAAEDASKFMMNEYQLKELLFMVSSRGNTANVEKLAELLKKEKEMLSK